MDAQNKLFLSFTDEELRHIFVEHLRNIGETRYAEMLGSQLWSCGLYFDEKKRCWTILLKETPCSSEKRNLIETSEEINDAIPQDYPVD